MVWWQPLTSFTIQMSGDCSLIHQRKVLRLFCCIMAMFWHRFQLVMQSHMKCMTTWKLLRCINYNQHQWQLCGDLMVVALLLGLQTGYTKYCCFLCERDSRATDWKIGHSNSHWSLGGKVFSIHHLLNQGRFCYHSYTSNWVWWRTLSRPWTKTQAAFKYHCGKPPRLSEAKTKEGVFVGPQNRELLFDDVLDHGLCN